MLLKNNAIDVNHKKRIWLPLGYSDMEEMLTWTK